MDSGVQFNREMQRECDSDQRPNHSVQPLLLLRTSDETAPNRCDLRKQKSYISTARFVIEGYMATTIDIKTSGRNIYYPIFSEGLSS